VLEAMARVLRVDTHAAHRILEKCVGRRGNGLRLMRIEVMMLRGMMTATELSAHDLRPLAVLACGPRAFAAQIRFSS
jgi:hypothetical protein